MGVWSLLKRPWTQQALNLLNGTSLPGVPDRLSNDQKSTIQKYAELQTALQKVVFHLQILDQMNPVVNPARSAVTALLASTAAPRDANGLRSAVESLQQAASEIDGCARSGRQEALDEAVRSVTAVVQDLPLQEDSELSAIVQEVAGELSGLVGDLERKLEENCRFTGAGRPFFLNISTSVLSYPSSH